MVIIEPWLSVMDRGEAKPKEIPSRAKKEPPRAKGEVMAFSRMKPWVFFTVSNLNWGLVSRLAGRCFRIRYLADRPHPGGVSFRTSDIHLGACSANVPICGKDPF